MSKVISGTRRIKPAHQILVLGAISADQAEHLLYDWANAAGSWPISQIDAQRFADGMERMRLRYSKLFGASDIFGHPLGHPYLREILRRAWTTSDAREREWLCFRLRDAFALMVRNEIPDRDAEIKEHVDVMSPRYAAPPINAFEAAIFYFQHQPNRTKHCRNENCPAPYFWVNKKGQEFCSPECARPSRLESQRQWWHEHRGKGGGRKHGT